MVVDPDDDHATVYASQLGTDESDGAGSASWQWTPDEWTYTETSQSAKGFADRPDERTLKAIAVAWQKPELDALGNICTLMEDCRLAITATGRRGPSTGCRESRFTWAWLQNRSRTGPRV